MTIKAQGMVWQRILMMRSGFFYKDVSAFVHMNGKMSEFWS